MLGGMTQEIASLLDEVDLYLRDTGMKETTFGRLAVNDGKCIGRLRKGGRAWPETVGRIRTYIAAHPAKDAPGSSQGAAA